MLCRIEQAEIKAAASVWRWLVVDNLRFKDPAVYKGAAKSFHRWCLAIQIPQAIFCLMSGPL